MAAPVLLPVPGVIVRLESQFSESDAMELSSSQRWDLLAPSINGGSLDAECLGDFLAGTAEKGENVLSKHGTVAYTMPSGGASPSKQALVYPVRMPTDHGMGMRIKTLREAREWSQGELARRVGVSRATVNQWESGRIKDIRLAAVLRLIEVLQTNLRYLVYGPSAPAAPASRSSRSSHE
jgi:putative transcriptional regulator